MRTLQELEELTLQWFKDRQIIPNSTPFAQCVKLFEEFTELLDGINKNDIDLIKDSIGDICVVLIGLNALHGNEPFLSGREDMIVSEFERSKIGHGLSFIGGQISRILDKDQKNGFFAKGCADLVLVSILGDIAFHYNSSLNECLELAFTEIEHRKGTLTPEGIFVKETK